MINLKKSYREHNKDYFGGRLPDITVEWSDAVSTGAVASSHVHGLTPCKHRYSPIPNCKSSYIRLHPELKQRDCFAEMTLIHEMVHVEALLGNKELVKHGTEFHRRMTVLAVLGAFDRFW